MKKKRKGREKKKKIVSGFDNVDVPEGEAWTTKKQIKEVKNKK